MSTPSNTEETYRSPQGRAKLWQAAFLILGSLILLFVPAFVFLFLLPGLPISALFYTYVGIGIFLVAYERLFKRWRKVKRRLSRAMVLARKNHSKWAKWVRGRLAVVCEGFRGVCGCAWTIFSSFGQTAPLPPSRGVCAQASRASPLGLKAARDRRAGLSRR